MTALALASLIGAIAAEAVGTICLRVASDGKKIAWAGVIIGYILAFSLLVVVLGEGVGLGVAYGIWAAAGVAITAIAGRVLFKEPLTWVMGLGIILIMAGVLLIEVGASA